MDEIERITEERFVEAMIHWWIQPDAPEWIINYVRQELRKQRGLLEEKVARDAEELLKGQEPVEPILALNDGEHELWQCGNCKVAVFQRGESYCHNCGRVVKWDG